MDLLKGKCAVITGCNRGIGRAILEKFCSYGAEIFALVRKETDDFLNDIKELSENIRFQFHLCTQIILMKNR